MNLNYFSTISNSGATNVDCSGEMVSVRDNGATNNDYIVTTHPQKFKHCWKEKQLN